MIFNFSLKLALVIFILNISLSFKSYSTGVSLNSSQFAAAIAKDNGYNSYTTSIFKDAHLDSAGLNLLAFQKALTGFYNLQGLALSPNSNILTVIDFDTESSKKRLFLIDVSQHKLLLNTWVAHGKNSGDDKTNHFSNVLNSYESSMGFYLTGEAYYGKNGRSMRLDGLDNGFNDNARNRAIVLHGADYVSQETINELGRLGRSFGCPAVPTNLSDQIIDATVNRSVIFINYSDDSYYSNYLDVETASRVALQNENFLASN